MNTPNYGFYFEKSGRGASQGAITPAEQFFEGSGAEDSLVRETGQNSIDARVGTDPVIMTFELAEMQTDLIPSITDLRKHLAQVEQETRNSQGHESMLLAYETACQEHVQVLRISDSGTTGLSGSESINTPKSPLSALTRGAGISADDGKRGGSFGIGSAVGPMASNMNTVLYTSLPETGSSVVFAGYSSLASHRDSEGIWRVGDGFYTDLDNTKDFRYLRDPGPIGPFDIRTEPGTDIYVLGYRKSDVDPGLQNIKVSFMRNFIMAIDRGHLVVHGVSSLGTWTLNRDELEMHVAEDPEAHAFYRAIKDPDPITEISNRFGKMSLYINVDDTLTKSLHTITMRQPLMKIDTFRHSSVPVKYAAVLECSEDKGNKILRTLEPPQHDRWDPGRASDGRAQVTELKRFVRRGLQSRVKEQIGDQVEIKGLSKYLPEELTEVQISAEASSGKPVSGTGSNIESSTVRGAESAKRSASPVTRTKVSVSVKPPASGEGSSPTVKGKNGGGSKTRKSKGGNRPGTGEKGNGSARITEGNVRFRSWSDPSNGLLYVALTPDQDLTGDLELVALGLGGSMEEDFCLPITQGTILTDGAAQSVVYEGNVLSSIELKAGVTSQIQLQLSTNHRYRIGVK
ncbi:hypothetical protein GCM10027417_11760 [Glutamicibacter endophyticus]